MTKPMTASEAREAAQYVEDGYPALATRARAKTVATLRAYADMLEREARVKAEAAALSVIEGGE